MGIKFLLGNIIILGWRKEDAVMKRDYVLAVPIRSGCDYRRCDERVADLELFLAVMVRVGK